MKKSSKKSIKKEKKQPKRKNIIRFLFIFLLGIVLGGYIYSISIDYFNVWAKEHDIIREEIIDTWQRNPENISCNEISKDKLMVILVAGQSNVANTGETGYTPKNKVYNFWNGECYKATDPLLGATGYRGSLWTRFAEIILRSPDYSGIMIATTAVGGTKIKSWADKNYLGKRIISTTKALNKAGFPPTHIFWHQGEDDARNFDSQEYKRNLKSVISIMRENSQAPIYVAKTSRCKDNRGIADLRYAQSSVVNNVDIFAGPNTDEIGFEGRFDGCHLSTEGLERAAYMWIDAIVKSSKLKNTEN